MAAAGSVELAEAEAITRAVRIDRTGPPEVMALCNLSLPPPGPGHARVRLRAIGVNFLDVYHRTGLYPLPLPSGLGCEGAGIVEAVGPGVTEVRVGDRVAFVDPRPGAYAEARNVKVARLVVLPAGIDEETAACAMVKGLTAQFLLRRTYRVQAGQTILFHAAAGGVGLIAVQWAKALGATVIGTAGSREKADLAREHGCDHVILYREEGIVGRVREITGGRMVPVVYDSVGKDTFQASLDCLQPFGTMVSFGSASGPIPPVPLTALKGSLFITRPSLMVHTEQRADLLAMSAELFEHLRAGSIRVRIGRRYPLEEAVRAHVDLESRETTGQSLLIPGLAAAGFP